MREEGGERRDEGGGGGGWWEEGGITWTLLRSHHGVSFARPCLSIRKASCLVPEKS